MNDRDTVFVVTEMTRECDMSVESVKNTVVATRELAMEYLHKCYLEARSYVDARSEELSADYSRDGGTYSVVDKDGCMIQGWVTECNFITEKDWEEDSPLTTTES